MFIKKISFIMAWCKGVAIQVRRKFHIPFFKFLLKYNGEYPLKEAAAIKIICDLIASTNNVFMIGRFGMNEAACFVRYIEKK